MNISLKDLGRPNRCRANASYHFAYQYEVGSHASGKGMLSCIWMQILIKIYRVVQKLWTFSLIAKGRNWCQATIDHLKGGYTCQWLGNLNMSM